MLISQNLFVAWCRDPATGERVALVATRHATRGGGHRYELPVLDGEYVVRAGDSPVRLANCARSHVCPAREDTRIHIHLSGDVGLMPHRVTACA